MSDVPAGMELRTVTAEEHAGFVRAVAFQFGETVTDEDVASYRELAELDRTFACFEGSRIVGTAANISFTVGLPWAQPVPCAGLTAVGVHPTRRRRGILTALMRRVLDDARGRGEPFASLYASEAAIYGRYGYGPAVPMQSLRISQPWGRLRHDAPDVARIELLEQGEALAALPPVYERVQRATPGCMSRSAPQWRELVTYDPESSREGHTARHFAVLGDRGYCIYRLKEGWRDGVADGTVRIVELIADDPEAYAALWSFVMAIDLMPNVDAWQRPLDEPVALDLVDPPRLRAEKGEPLYLRLVDLPAALTARGYRASGSVVLEVADRMLPANAGRWRLDASPSGATCERTDDAADLVLDTTELATAFLGAVRVEALARARRVVVQREEAVGTLDRLLAAPRAPWNPRMF